MKEDHNIRKIEFYNDFVRRTDEAYNTSVPIEWDKINNVICGKFFVKKTEYKIIAEIILHGFMTFKFKAFHNNEFTITLTNKGTDAIQVIPTIKDAIEFILNDVSPNGIVFGATDESTGRKHIYDRFCKNWLEQNSDWDFNEYTIENMKLYMLYKKSISNKIQLDVLEWVKDNGLSYNE